MRRMRAVALSGFAVCSALPLALALALAAFAGPALADESSEAMSDSQALAQGSPQFMDVVTRPRPDYDAKGLPLGAFRLFPSLTAGVFHDDNVYRQATLEKSDTVYTIAPSLSLRSEWSRHSLELHASSVTFIYSKLSHEDRTDWNAGGSGRLDVLRSFVINADGDYTRTHEDRSSPDLPGYALEPTPFAHTVGHLSAQYQPNRFAVSFGGGIDRFAYDSVPKIGGGTLENNDRDRDIYTVFGKLSYEFSPGYAAFVRATYDDRKFDLKYDRSGLQRDSHGTEYDGGLDMLLGHLLRGQVFAGYIQQNFIAPLPDVSGLDFGARLDWFVTPLTTLRLDASRTINDTTLAGASAEDDRNVGVSIDHELLRSMLLHGHVGYTDSKFDGLTREDKTWDAAISAKWLLNRYLNAELGYNYRHRNSNFASGDYSDNIFGLKLTGQL